MFILKKYRLGFEIFNLVKKWFQIVRVTAQLSFPAFKITTFDQT